MATPLSHKIVASKMDILEEQRNYLQTFVDETDKVLQLSTSWLRNEETTKNFPFTEISKMIDDKLAFLVSTDFSVGCGEAATGQELVATRSFPSASKSTDQPFPAGHVHVSGVTAASDELKTILSQVNAMQEAMSSLSTSSKMLSEKQLAMEKLVESLSDKYYKVEQEKLREIEGELEDIKEEHKKAAIQQDKRITSFEKKIQEVADTQSDIIENCHQQQIKIKDQKKETEKLKTQSQKLTKDLRDVLKNVQEQSAEISVLEKKTGTNTQMGASEGEIESLKESLVELSTRFEEHGSSLEEFTQRNDETLKVLTSATKNESEKLQRLENKLSALENSWSETTVENGKLCQDVETKYEMVCQVVIDRLVPLERLRDIFNRNLDARAGHIKKLNNVCDQMADILSKFLQVEQQTQRQAIGFSAKLHSCLYPTNKEILILHDVISNHGDHYDSKTGKFTASLNGLYAVYFNVITEVDRLLTEATDNNCSSFLILKKPCYCGDNCNDCRSSAAHLQDITQASTFGLVEMKAGEQLFVQCLTTRESITVVGSKFISFKIF